MMPHHAPYYADWGQQPQQYYHGPSPLPRDLGTVSQADYVRFGAGAPGAPSAYGVDDNGVAFSSPHTPQPLLGFLRKHHADEDEEAAAAGAAGYLVSPAAVLASEKNFNANARFRCSGGEGAAAAATPAPVGKYAAKQQQQQQQQQQQLQQQLEQQRLYQLEQQRKYQDRSRRSEPQQPTPQQQKRLSSDLGYAQNRIGSASRDREERIAGGRCEENQQKQKQQHHQQQPQRNVNRIQQQQSGKEEARNEESEENNGKFEGKTCFWGIE